MTNIFNKRLVGKDINWLSSLHTLQIVLQIHTHTHAHMCVCGSIENITPVLKHSFSSLNYWNLWYNCIEFDSVPNSLYLLLSYPYIALSPSPLPIGNH